MTWFGCAQTETGYRLEAVTIRKLEFENDAFAFGDKVIEKWYPTVEVGGNKGILVLVTTGKDGALTGGPAFNKVLDFAQFRLCSKIRRGNMLMLVT